MIHTNPSIFHANNIKPRGIVYGGARIGEDIAFFQHAMTEELGLDARAGSPYILAVEPNPTAFAALKRYESPYVHCVQGALGNTNGTYEYYAVDDYPWLNSTLPPNPEFWSKRFGAEAIAKNPVSRSFVAGFTIDSLVASLQSRYNVIYLNIQGGELQALEGAKATMANHVDGVFLEVNFEARYLSGALFHEVSDFLDRSGFALSYLQKYPSMGLVHGEAFFIRRNGEHS